MPLVRRALTAEAEGVEEELMDMDEPIAKQGEEEDIR